MTVRVKDILAVMEELAPKALAESWDNVGLAVGDPEWPAEKVRVALTPDPEVVEAALSEGAGLLITHHPLIFKAIKNIDLATPLGSLLAKAITGRLAVYCAHTNLDKAPGGVNQVLANRLGLVEIRRPEWMENSPEGGLFLLGNLPGPTPLAELAAFIKERVRAPMVRIAGDPGASSGVLALCAGSGAGLIPDFLRSEAGFYLTGDLKYHDAKTIVENGKGCIDIGHFASEHLVVEALAGELSLRLAQKGLRAGVAPLTLERDPFTWL